MSEELGDILAMGALMMTVFVIFAGAAAIAVGIGLS